MRTTPLSDATKPGRRPCLKIRLFGKLSVECGEHVLADLTATKVQELFCFLLLHRQRPHSREVLAALLWGDTPTAQSKKYLRQILWQLQAALRLATGPSGTPVLLVDSNWVSLNPDARLGLDVADFEDAFASMQGVAYERMSEEQATVLATAVELYQGDLLEGCYSDWCMRERDRLQRIYLTMLDKIMGYCESRGRLEEGLRYGALSLRYDRACERSHQHLMRMHCLAGDRAAAVRQFHRCARALEEELGVEPSDSTVELYRQITAGQPCEPICLGSTGGVDGAASTLPAVLVRLKEIDVMLTRLRSRVRSEIGVVERTISRAAGAGCRETSPTVHFVPARQDRSRGPKRAAHA